MIKSHLGMVNEKDNITPKLSDRDELLGDFLQYVL